jgi:glycosyltransferase involved in cell wall biosynthesis
MPQNGKTTPVRRGRPRLPASESIQGICDDFPAERLPMAMIEAMRCGLPAVVFDHADIRDVALHGKNSLLCSVDDLDCFVVSVERLLQNTEIYDFLSENALKLRDEKKKDFAMESIRRIWEDTLAKLDCG